ncbi:MAG: hypothetical protein NT076_05635 [Candidatus Pacearchaeota archaeon]|nr:hypothetical protein [Candidatus Pacearchaeota archaeon]
MGIIDSINNLRLRIKGREDEYFAAQVCLRDAIFLDEKRKGCDRKQGPILSDEIAGLYREAQSHMKKGKSFGLKVYRRWGLEIAV